MRTALLSAICVAGLSAPAFSATISVETFSVADYNTAISGFTTTVKEDFEGFGEGNQNDGFSTAVGTFATIGGTGSGGTVTDPDGFVNDGSKLAVRDGNVYGRQSTTKYLTGQASDDKFLDSNDTYGISWNVSLGGAMFDKVVFTLTDATDVGATIRISSGSDSYSFAGDSNGNIKTVVVSFGGAVSSALIEFENFKNRAFVLNDGFSLDDMAVNDVSPVPLPASSLLLVAGIGALVAARRKRQA